MSNCEATTTLKIRMKNIPNSNVLGNVRTYLLNEAAIANVVIVRMIINSLSFPVIASESHAPIINMTIEINNPIIIFGKVLRENIPL